MALPHKSLASNQEMWPFRTSIITPIRVFVQGSVKGNARLLKNIWKNIWR